MNIGDWFIKRNTILLGLFVLLMAIRVASVFTIVPGNAPDEPGHVVAVNILAEPGMVSFEKTMEYSGYPYGIYNPAPYLPSSVVVYFYSVFNPKVKQMTKPINGLHYPGVYLARLGQLFWTAVFLLFLILATNSYSLPRQILMVASLGLVPQIIFVQSYVNSDAMGPAVFAYMAWAVLNRKRWHVAFSCFLLINAKLNYFCLLPIIVLYIMENQRIAQTRSFSLLLKDILLCLVLPICCGSWFFVYNFFHNTGELKSFLGFPVLEQLMGLSHADHWNVFSRKFLYDSIISSFGVFGWMNQEIGSEVYYWIWFLLLFTGFFYLIALALLRKNKSIYLTGLLVIFLNLAFHFWASFSGAYQAQGRYLFPSVLIILFSFNLMLIQLSKTTKTLGKLLSFALMAFMLLSAALGVSSAHKNILNIKYGNLAKISDAPVFLWQNRSAANEVTDPMTQSNRICRVEPHRLARYGRYFEMELTGGYFEAETGADDLLAACQRWAQLSIEAVLTPKQPGSSRKPADGDIVSFASTPAEYNFILSQQGGRLTFRLCPPSRDLLPPLYDLCALTSGVPQHVIVSVMTNQLTCYLNGVPVYTTNRVACGPWTNQRLLFGDANWAGTIEGIAIYARWIDAKEALKKFARYSPRLQTRASPPPVIVAARLLEAARVPNPKSIAPCRRALAGNRYRVDKVLAGQCHEQEIMIAQWAILDAQIITQAMPKANNTYRLVLEPYVDHPELEGERLIIDRDRFNLPLYYADLGKGSDAASE